LGIYRRATRQYTLQKYPGSVDLFLHPANSEDCLPQSWSQIAAGDVEVHEISDGHDEILKEPYVRIWAESLKACLSRAEAAQQNRSAVDPLPDSAATIFLHSAAEERPVYRLQ